MLKKKIKIEKKEEVVEKVSVPEQATSKGENILPKLMSSQPANRFDVLEAKGLLQVPFFLNEYERKFGKIAKWDVEITNVGRVYIFIEKEQK